MKKALRDKLLSITDLTDIVGQNVFSSPVDTTTNLPYIVINKIEEKRYNYLNGHTDVYRGFWQIDIYSETELQAEQIKQIIDDNLNLVTGTWDTIPVYNCYMQASRNLSELENVANQNAVKRVQMDFIIIRGVRL